MKQTTKSYITRLYDMYSEQGDTESLLALADESKRDDRAQSLKIYREQQKTQELIRIAMVKFKTCVERLTNPNEWRTMTTEDRAYCFAAMDWARYTLDIVGEDPSKLEKQVEEVVESYARKAGIS